MSNFSDAFQKGIGATFGAIGANIVGGLLSIGLSEAFGNNNGGCFGTGSIFNNGFNNPLLSGNGNDNYLQTLSDLAMLQDLTSGNNRNRGLFSGLFGKFFG